MQQSKKNNFVKLSALVAGYSLLAVGVLAICANYVYAKSDILASGGLLQFAASLFIAVAILDIVAAYHLHRVFARVDKTLSYAMMLARITYAVIIFVGAAVILMQDNIDVFNTVWHAGLLVFALHFILLAILIFRAAFAANWLSVLVAITGLGYVVDSVGIFLVPNYAADLTSLTLLGEVALIFWLLWLGYTNKQKVK